MTGHGYLGGDPPQSADPDAPDGRARILNEPARVRIVIISRLTMVAIDSVLSDTDGRWRVNNLNEGMDFIAVGLDDRGLVNAAIQDWVRPAPMRP